MLEHDEMVRTASEAIADGGIGPPCSFNAMRALETMPSALLVVGSDDRIRYTNSRARQILGRSQDELIGFCASDILGVQLHARLGEERCELSIERPDGSRRTIGYAISPCNGDALIIFQDISEFVQLRDERDRLMRMAAIGEALPSLLHELKNPLAAVTTAVEVLLEEVPEGQVMDQLHAVLTEVRRMKLGFEGIGAVGRKLSSPHYAAIDFACKEACRVLQPRLRNAHVFLRYHVSDMPLLPLDPAVVRALVFNLVINSLHACKVGRHIPTGKSVVLYAHLDHTGEHFELIVVDTGAGMPPDILAKATQLFFTTKPSGSGIGLALCNRAVREAGGEMEISSVPDVGTKVVIVVPVTRPTTK